MKNIFSKQRIAIGLLVGTVIIAIIIIPYLVEIIPQLFTMNQVEYKVSEQATDDEVKEMLEEIKLIKGPNLGEFAITEFKNKNYKLSYNAYKYIAELDLSMGDKTDYSEVGVIYSMMSECNHKVFNFKEAIRYIELAYEVYPEEEDLYFYIGIRLQRAIVNYNNDIDKGFINSEKVVYMLKEVLAIDTTSETLESQKSVYKEGNTKVKKALIKLYTFSPSVHDLEQVIRLHKELIEEYPEEASLRYSLVGALIDNGNIEEAKKSWENYRELEHIKVNEYTISARINMAEGNYESAKKAIDKLEKIAINHISKIKYYQVSAMYYNDIGDKEKGREYLVKLVEQGNEEVYTYQIIQLEEVLDANPDYIREKLEKERNEREVISLDVEE